jgi:hypothetical protein
MWVEKRQEKEHKKHAVHPQLLDGIVIKEYVTVYLREAQYYIKYFQVSLVLQVLVGVIFTFRL